VENNAGLSLDDGDRDWEKERVKRQKESILAACETKRDRGGKVSFTGEREFKTPD